MGTNPVGIAFGVGGKSEGTTDIQGYPRPKGGPLPEAPIPGKTAGGPEGAVGRPRA